MSFGPWENLSYFQFYPIFGSPTFDLWCIGLSTITFLAFLYVKLLFVMYCGFMDDWTCPWLTMFASWSYHTTYSHKCLDNPLLTTRYPFVPWQLHYTLHFRALNGSATDAHWMMGNTLNPNSNMVKEMSVALEAESKMHGAAVGDTKNFRETTGVPFPKRRRVRLRKYKFAAVMFEKIARKKCKLLQRAANKLAPPQLWAGLGWK